MLFYVVKCFTVNLEKLPANAVREVQITVFNEQIHRQTVLASETLREAQHQFTQIRALDAQRAHVRDHTAQILALLLDSLLQTGEFRAGPLRCLRKFVPHDVELNFKAEQRLQNSVMQIPRNPADR